MTVEEARVRVVDREIREAISEGKRAERRQNAPNWIE
jgi:hypothetical protein